MATPGQIQTVAKHFVIAAIWADCEEGTNPRANNKTHRIAFDICKAFIDANNDLFNEAMARADEGYGAHPDAGSAEAAFGHDLWLTSQGHGTGFWDRDELDAGDLGRRLTDALETFQKVIDLSGEH
jgi:hypothetical protein